MTSTTVNPNRLEVLIAGGGVAAIETAIALNKLAGELIRLTLLAPDDDFIYRPLTLQEAFGHGPPKRYSLLQIADALGADLVKDRFAWVQRDAQLVHTESDRTLPYGALALCLGAKTRVRYPHALTIDEHHAEEVCGLVQDIKHGAVSRVAFVAPEPLAWPLPLYEVALMSVEYAAHEMEFAAWFVTPEPAPLEIFGDAASREVSKLLRERGIELISSARVEVPQAGQVVIRSARSRAEIDRFSMKSGPDLLLVDRVVALPALYGRSVRGLPGTVNGFIPVDRYCQVRGAQRIYAAGDGTDFPVKHGGIAAQQGTTVARGIAALAGAAVRPTPFHPTIQGVLMTGAAGGRACYLSARITGGHASGSQITRLLTSPSPPKVAAEHLVPFLEQLAR